MHIACWIHKATDTHSEYVILSPFRLQQLLHKRTSALRYTYIVCLVINSRTAWMWRNNYDVFRTMEARTAFTHYKAFKRMPARVYPL